MKELVSVCIPTWNRGHYLGEALVSLMNQTYKPMEVIVVSDGCTDSTPILMEYFTKKYPEQVFYYQKSHSGIADTRNFAISKSTGSFICVADSDDLYVKTRLERQMKVFKKYPDIDFVYSGYMETNEHLVGQSVVDAPKSFTAEDIRDNRSIPHPTIIARRHCFIDHPYNEEFTSNDDKQLLWDWFRAGYKGKPVDDALCLKRNHDQAISYTDAKQVDKFNQRIDAEINEYLKTKV